MPSSPDQDASTDSADSPFRDAEAWLAERGIERDPIEVAPRPHDQDDRPPVSEREARRLATEAPPAPPPSTDTNEDDHGGDRPDLGDLVREALGFARRSTAKAPQSEQRLRTKLAGRDYPQVVIDRAIAQCRAEGTVDDHALAAAIAEERHAKGHAPFRIRVDLGKRGFTEPVIDEVLAAYENEDPEAAAFDVALGKARSTRHLDAEKAYRRVVGFVARRGYPPALARKVARQAVFAEREDERTAGR